MTTTQDTRMRTVEARMFLYIAQSIESPVHALAEYVDNAIDAGAKNVWVVLARDHIVIADNGEGMVPWIMPDDKAMLGMFFEDIAQGRQPGYEDVRVLMDKRSLQSLEWMMRCVSLSPKIPQRNSNARGMRGIGGTLAFLRIANRAVWLTKPHPRLAKEYWSGMPAEFRVQVKKTSAFQLLPPTKNDLEANLVRFQIEAVSDSIRAPDGEELLHGTVVEIKELDPEIEMGLRLPLIVDQFRSRYGEDVRTNRVHLTLIDRISDEGRRTSGGRAIVIEPPQYKGVLIHKGDLWLPKAEASFGVEIYYDPKATNARPMLRRRGSNLRPITDLPEFNCPPWNSGRLAGFVDFPSIPSKEEGLWTTDKRMPVESPTRNHWQEAVNGIGPAIEAEIARLQDTQRKRKSDELANRVATALADSMKELAQFRDVLPQSRLANPPSGTRGKNPMPLDRVTAVVFNEHNRGVEGIKIQLYRGSELMADKITGRSGELSFGKLGSGKYRVRATVEGDSPATFLEADSYRFEIDGETRLGFRALFRVHEGTPAPETRRLPRIVVLPTTFDDPTLLWRSRLQLGAIDVNREYPAIRGAEVRNDEETVTAIYAYAVSSAIASHCLPGIDPGQVMQYAAQLFGEVLARLGQKSAKGRR